MVNYLRLYGGVLGMFLDFSKKISKNFICCVLVVYVLLAEVFSANALINKTVEAGSTSTSCFLDVSSGCEANQALLRDNSLSKRVDSDVRLRKKKNTDYEKSVRTYILGILLSALVFAVSVILLHFYRVIDYVEQRLSIIIYIHNKDGLKRIALS